VGDAPRANPVPLLIAVVVSLVLLMGIVAVLTTGGDDEEALDEPVVLGDGSLPPDGNSSDVSTPPDVEFVYFDDTPGTLEDWAGTPVVLNFFASWCAPCIEEMPALEAVSKDYAGTVTFVGMNTSDTLEDGQRIADQTEVTYTLTRDPDGSVLRAFDGLVMPTTIFLDAEGQVVRRHLGRITAGELRQIIEQDLLS
jgi:cytochrome c biogenesis protein CcmG/thiol:disulfide interchange protein DsbE